MLRGLLHRSHETVRRLIAPDRGIVAKDSYATHVPTLVALGTLRGFRSVLELGVGIHSTSAFRDSRVLPDLQSLVSVESDVYWVHRVVETIGCDPRHRILLTDKPIPEFVHELDLSEYDMIFIDDSLTPEDRSRTIHAVMRARSGTSVIVIHDFENRAYRRAAKGATRCFVFDAFIPHVGILWDGAILDARPLKALRDHVYNSATPENAGDRAYWLGILRTYFKAWSTTCTTRILPNWLR